MSPSLPSLYHLFNPSLHGSLFPYSFSSDYGYARYFDLNALCIRDPTVELSNPCADGDAKTYMASTG